MTSQSRVASRKRGYCEIFRPAPTPVRATRKTTMWMSTALARTSTTPCSAPTSARARSAGIGTCLNNVVTVINNGQRPEARPRGNVPPPPLIFSSGDIPPVPDPTNSVKVKLYHDPNQVDSGKYETHAFYFKSGQDTPEHWCDWILQLHRISRGQALNGGPPRYRLARDLLRDQYLRDFNAIAQQQGPETIANLLHTLHRMSTIIFPAQAKHRMCHHLRTALRKPRSMTTRAMYGRIKDIENKMSAAGIPLDLTEENEIEIIIGASPTSFVIRMYQQNFDPATHSVTELIELFERFEEAESIASYSLPARRTPAGRRSLSPRRRNGQNDRPGRYGQGTNNYQRGRPNNFDRYRNEPYPQNAAANHAPPNFNRYNRFQPNRRPMRRTSATSSNWQGRGGGRRFDNRNGGRGNGNWQRQREERNNRFAQNRVQEANAMTRNRQDSVGSEDTL